MVTSRSICHYGPLLALSIIITLFLCGLYCTLLWFPPWASIAGAIHVTVFVSWVTLIIKYFLKAIWLGPGYLPLRWRLDDVTAASVLQFCAVCNGYKAPRSHHCSKCGRCVMKMDHHCPWINSCVGHMNHRSFILFLFFVPFGCTHATVILICCCLQQFYVMPGNFYRRALFQRTAVVSFTFSNLIVVLFCIGLSVGVTIAILILLYYQVKGILTNKTQIETWIVEKADDRLRFEGDHFTYPYDLGWKENFKQVMPLRHNYNGDGITWPVVEGCDQYTLTREQLQQKKLKRERKVCCNIVKSYNGSIVAWREGVRTCSSYPCSDEPRMKVQVGQTVLVSRWKKYWLYGEKITFLNDQAERVYEREKGWFPRLCTELTPKKDI
ncbi:palmitoyltransferase ZDHHC6-like isoform X2 [Acropora millepora]|uniref:palmitoyltransferase ZDHHC6-like isoform X2 n=1 Tax=Acropora millepora TaxID=45264 RepID=UPI001CF49D9A|nr:palmitoyltransferase ZDHHC6-like isoform X2 [Acropora millepora]